MIVTTKPTLTMIIFTKFFKDRRKIVHFLQIGGFYACSSFYNSASILICMQKRQCFEGIRNENSINQQKSKYIPASVLK